MDSTRQKIVEYLTPKSPHFTDQESDTIEEIRRLFATLEPVKQLGLISELTSRLYQAAIRR